MKRRLNVEDGTEVTESVQSPVIDWTQQDRQPGWEENQPSQQAEDSDPDGDDFILESRRRQQRLVTPEQLESGSLSPPGAPVKKKRRVLPWTEEGQKKWPLVSKYDVFHPPDGVSYSTCDCGDGVNHDGDPVVQVEDSTEESVDGGETEEDDSEDDSEDDCSSFVVDDDSESLVEEESVSEVSLGREALLEVRAGIMEKIRKLQCQLESVDEELGGLTSVDGEHYFNMI